MFKLRVDTSKNRLYITMIGFFPLEEMNQWSGETIAAVKKMRRGYDVILDLSQFKPTTPEGTREIERVQSFFKLSGARQGVQVIGDNVLGGLQFKRMSVKTGFDPSNVNTLAEAEKLLGP